MLRNIASRLKFLQVLANASLTADTNTTGVDCANYGSMLFILSVGAFSFDGSNNVAVKVEYSDDNSSWSAVPEAEMYVVEGSGNIAKVLDAGGDASAAHIVEYRGSKRYARLALDVTGTVSVGASVVAMGGYPKAQPAA